MALTLQQIIGREEMLDLITSVKTGVKRAFPDQFYRSRQKLDGDSGKYLRVNGTRKTASLVQYGNASRRRALAGVDEVAVKLIHSFEHQSHGPVTLQKLIPTDGTPIDGAPTEEQKMGYAEIVRQTELFKMQFDNLRETAIGMALARGVVYFDGDGNMLDSSSGAVVTADFGVPAGNKGQLNYKGTGAIIGASWATAGTDIIGQMEALHRAAQELTGYPIAHAFYGRNILRYLASNTVLGGLINANPVIAQAITQQQIPNGFLRVGQWHAAYDAMWSDAGGNYYPVIPDDTVVFTPEPSPDWWDVLEGTFVVPTGGAKITAEAADMLKMSLKRTYGMFTYAVEERYDPPSIIQYAGDTFLPVIKVPQAVWIADVTP